MRLRKQFVDFFSKSYQEKRGIRWGIERKGTKGIIGTIGFNAWLPKHKRAEIGYEIHPDYWRKGYTSEAVSKVITYGFGVMNLTRIGAVVFIENEVTETSREWGGYFVAIENNEVVGAIGGGMINATSGEVFVLYLNPNRRNEGIGSLLLEALTKQQKETFHAAEQWVSVAKGNHKGIPFYEAKGFIFKNEQNGYHNLEEEKYSALRYSRQIV